MLSDRKASQLISQSLQRKLTDEEQREIDANLDRSEASRGFQKLSQAIQNSVADVARLAEEGDKSIAPGLSAEAKTRLRDSIRLALQQPDVGGEESALASSDRGVGESDIDMAVAEPQPGESRQMNSRFTLIRRMGHGGLGTVWLARDEKLKRNVAIKQMNSTALESPSSWERFHREAEITGKLEHPNVVPIYQFGTDSKTGQPFYAMRFLGKQTLANAVIEHHERRNEGDDDTLGFHRMLTAFLEICQAIAYAHSRGVIHRDLKPENVALDHFGQVIVLDWGLAKLIEDGELASERMLNSGPDESALRTTIVGEIVGTPLYMSPEQASGQLDEIDERTDVYGLGAILFAILTGSAPHENSCTSVGGTVRVEELLKAISERDTPLAIELNSTVSRALADVCRKAMARRKSARHAGASELAADIERWMAGQNERRKQYDRIRLEGREIRSVLASTVRTLETNARFMCVLPPIQGIINAEQRTEGDDTATWRDRMATIFKGLMQANGDFAAVTFSRVHDGNVRQIVRVQRHSTDYSNVRSVPLSRLATTAIDDFVNQVMSQDPEEVYATIVDKLPTVPVARKSPPLKLIAGVPVFDATGEEPFGLVTIECDVHRLVENAMRSEGQACGLVVLVSTDGKVLVHHKKGSGRKMEAEQSSANEVFPRWMQIQNEVSAAEDFNDDVDFRVFATRLHLGHGDNYVTIVVQ